MSSSGGQAAVAARVTEEIGVIVVHGIGEQGRFQHLDGEIHQLVRALMDLFPGGKVTVDISSAGAGAFFAVQDSWTAGSQPSARIVIQHDLNGSPQESRLMIHEVWWADVNERYSLAKQFRFWLWGLGVWAHPGKTGSALEGAKEMQLPRSPRGSWSKARVGLFLVGVFFVLVGYSLGALFFVITRLLNLQMPDLLRTLTNYVSGVKLYNQKRRLGPGFPSASEDFLDTVGEPPGVSIRRRMVRSIADVACRTVPYDRWYVLAHSLGSVVAFNGLMETAYAWSGYLDEERWRLLRTNGFIKYAPPPHPGTTMPRRPVWADPAEMVDRQKIFARFRGLLTYGSPLEKFAAIWPAMVPISKDAVFTAEWINLYDPIDPVSGILRAFDQPSGPGTLQPRNIGYTASWRLLIAHLKYLTHRDKNQTDAATAVAKWMLTGAKFAPPSPNRYWFTDSDRQYHFRRLVAGVSTLVAAVVFLGFGAYCVPKLLAAIDLAKLCPWAAGGLDAMTDWLAANLPFGDYRYVPRMVLLLASAILLTAGVGVGFGFGKYFQPKRDGTANRATSAPRISL